MGINRGLETRHDTSRAPGFFLFFLCFSIYCTNDYLRVVLLSNGETPKDKQGPEKLHFSSPRVWFFFINYILHWHLFANRLFIWHHHTPAATTAIPSIGGFILFYFNDFSIWTTAAIPFNGVLLYCSHDDHGCPPSIGRVFLVSHSNTTVMNRARGADASQAPCMYFIINLNQ